VPNRLSFVEIAGAKCFWRSAKFKCCLAKKLSNSFSEFAGFVAFVAATLHTPPFDGDYITGALRAVSSRYVYRIGVYNSDIRPNKRHTKKSTSGEEAQVEKHKS